jgi:predicted CopG family antitoxin
MQQKMTITIDREVYDALYRVVGKGNISKFLENLARPHVMKEDLASAYQAMAADTEREREALEWSNGLMLGETHAEEAIFDTSSPTARFHPLGSVNDAQG